MPELLSPAGDMTSMYAAVNNGADAIYLGGKAFSARNLAQNFTDDELKTVVEYSRLRGVKVYITINTLYKNTEIHDVLVFVEKMYKLGVNAFILQDIGMISEIKKHFPDALIHASTQMTVHNLEGVKYLKNQGLSRVVLSRETSISTIEEINKKLDIETEVFAHGALCVSYSGQCLMSSLIGTRSGNRGRCAQPCRLKYDLLKNGKSIASDYLLSPKDIMTLEILEDIINSGVTSLKIEGRMKSAEYVAIVTKAYREQIDKIKNKENSVDEKTLKNVTQIFNRGGNFSTSYFNSYSGADMMSNKTPKSTGLQVGRVVSFSSSREECIIEFEESLVPGDGIEIWTVQEPHVGTNISKHITAGQKFPVNISGDIHVGDLVYRSYDKTLADDAKRIIKTENRQMNIAGYVEAKLNKPLKLKISYKDICVVKEGGVAQQSQSTPITAEKILKQLSKTGNTPFKIQYDKFDIDENIYISVGELNSLRREIIEEFENLFINSIKRTSNLDFKMNSEKARVVKQKLTVQAKNISQLKSALNENVSRIYFEYNNDINEAIEKCAENNIELFISFPLIANLNDSISALENLNIDGYLISEYGQLQILEDIGTSKKIMLNYNFNIFNNLSLDFFKSKEIGVTLSPELNFNELKDLGTQNSELIIHGKQNIMITKQCPVGIYDAKKSNNKYCKNRNNKDSYSLLDRKKVSFEVMTDCDNCIAYILNSKTLSTYSKFEDIKSLNVEYLRLVFNLEEPEYISETIELYTKMLNAESVMNRDEEATYGHFYRGVE